jgi:hypothetical protein
MPTDDFERESPQSEGELRLNLTLEERECVEEAIDRDLSHVFEYRGRSPFVVEDVTDAQKDMLMKQLYGFEQHMKKNRRYRLAESSRSAANKVYESEVIYNDE